MMTRTALKQDRRKKTVVQAELSNTQVPPWFPRIEADVQNEVSSNHDRPWQDADPQFWLTHYKLLKHLSDASRLLVAMSTNDGEMAVRAMLGTHHDIGKIFEPYNSLYRKNGYLTPSEIKVMRGHASRSKQYVLELSRKVRKKDQSIFRYVAAGVGRHHKPWLIFRPWLRQIVWDLYFLDGFLAAIEKRHDSSKSVVVALESAHQESKKLPLIVQILMKKEIQISLDSLDRVVMAGTLIE